MNFMKKCMITLVIVLLSFTISTSVFAAYGYDKSNIDSFVGKKVIDVNYYHSSKGYYPYKKRLDNKGTMQCVGYVYARLEEKLGLSPDFISGAGAKDIPTNAPNGATRTAADGTKYTIEVYTNDSGSHLTSNSWMSFGAGSSVYGHVIYVEEVIGDTVYYTESGTNLWKNGTAGTLRKKSKSDLITNGSSGGKYIGTVVFKNSTANSHIHNFTYDVANEKCYCGAQFTRQYQDINQKYTVIKDGTAVKSKPYSECGERYARLNIGDVVTVKRTFKNVYGNVWCEVDTGQNTGYMYFGDLKGESNLTINLTAYPSSIKVGSSFGLRGSISSNYNIKKVSGYIMQGNTVIQSTTDMPEAKTMDIRPANLNQRLLFNQLSAGDYSLYIEAVDASGKMVGVNKNFNVYNNSDAIQTQTKVESTLSINLEKYPVSISVGSIYGLRGSITSNYNISKVKGYIYNSDGGVVQETTDTPNSTYMDIRPANLNQRLIFNALSAGSYTMKVEAVDASGKVVTATKSFMVGNTSVSQNVSPPSVPEQSATTSIRFELETIPSGNLPYGKTFTLKGWFRSDSPIVEARAYMLDANQNIVMQSDKASSTTSNYQIQGYKLDKAMKFNQLSPGGYYLKYFVRDANGDTATWISDMFYIVK